MRGFRVVVAVFFCVIFDQQPQGEEREGGARSGKLCISTFFRVEVKQKRENQSKKFSLFMALRGPFAAFFCALFQQLISNREIFFCKLKLFSACLLTSRLMNHFINEKKKPSSERFNCLRHTASSMIGKICPAKLFVQGLRCNNQSCLPKTL